MLKASNNFKMIPNIVTKFAFLLISCLLFISLVPNGGSLAQDTTNDAYCFEFTWLGENYQNGSNVNGTCDDMEPKPPICVNPLVYTVDGSFPNTTAMWQDSEIRKRVRCRLTSNEVCAKWTYYYNGKVENTTHLCTKITVDGKSAMTGGCESQFKDGFLTEVCACTSIKGENVLPCNRAPSLVSPLGLLVLTAAIALLASWHV